MKVVNSQNLSETLKHWISKSILENNVQKFDDQQIYVKALEIFKFDYLRYFPGDNEIYLDKILLRAELQGIILYRIAREYFLIGNPLADYFSLLGRYLSGFEIYYSAQIGKGLKIHHGLGTVVGARTVIGENCLLHQNVTFGDKDGGRPKLNDNVTVYAGAKIIGNIEIGNNVIIGANSVCLTNIPDNAIAIGVPARFLNKL